MVNFMINPTGKYAVPEHIRAQKPRGTCVKNIKGNYYVYQQFNVKGNDGKWHTKSGSIMGKIVDGVGYIPNDIHNYEEEVTTLEYGQYAVTLANTNSVLKRLCRFFNKEDAYRIYLTGVIHFVNKFRHRKIVGEYISQSYLSVLYPKLAFGEESLGKLVDSLGRRQKRVFEFEQSLIEDSSKEIAIDGHVIRNCSHRNDLAAFGNKYKSIKDMQLNVLMAYDIKTNTPLLSRMYEGGTLDKVSIRDLIDTITFSETLFIVDRGFYSDANIKLFSENGNRYIIPLSSNLSRHKKATEDMNLTDTFVYKKDRKNTAIQYKDMEIDGQRVIVFRDTVQNAIDAEKYRSNIGIVSHCTQDAYKELKEFFGVIILQTNLSDTPEKVFNYYKKRWKIETFYNYLKNDVDFNALYEQDYYKLQGMSFIMLITSLIHEEMHRVVMDALPGKTVDDCIIEARMVKINLRYGRWIRTNMKKPLQELFAKLHTDYESSVIATGKYSST